MRQPHWHIFRQLYLEMETSEYLFDLDDQEIFSAKNSDLKAKVLRYHLMPRLNRLLKVAMQQAQAIFEVDLMEHSTISQSPGFRTDRRKGEITMDYDWCKIGLTGVRKPIWSKIHNRKTGKSPVVSYISWDLELIDQGLVATVSLPANGPFTKESYELLLQPLVRNAGSIATIMNRSHVRFYSNAVDVKATASLAERLQRVSTTREPEVVFATTMVPFPIPESKGMNIAHQLGELFLIYDTWIRAAQGLDDRVDHMLSKLDSFYDWCDKNNVATEETDEEGNDADVDLSSFPVEKTSVLPAKRYQVFQRDDWKCVSCGKDPLTHGITLHIDHITPRSKGGLNQVDNYQTLCDTCNLGKGNRDSTNIRELHGSGK